MLAVREGKLSPLAIKRPPSVLHKPEYTEGDYGNTRREHYSDTKHFSMGLLVFSDLLPRRTLAGVKLYHISMAGGAVCLNVPVIRLAEEAEASYEKQNVPSFARWKPRMYRWEEAKEIPIAVRMATPFQRGNVCEDPERCDALEKRVEIQAKASVRNALSIWSARSVGIYHKPRRYNMLRRRYWHSPICFSIRSNVGLVEKILKEVDEPDRLCIIIRAQLNKLFLECKLSKKLLEEWSMNLQGYALGNFAKALLHAVEIETNPMPMLSNASARWYGSLNGEKKKSSSR